MLLVLLFTRCYRGNQITQIEKLIAAEQYSKAMELVNQELANHNYKPNNNRIYYQKAFLEEMVGDIDSAATYYLLCVDHSYYEPNAWNNLGNILNMQGKYNLALNCFKTSISMNPNDPVPLSNKARVEFNLGLYSDAIKTFAKAQDKGFILNESDHLLKASSYYHLDSLYKAKMIFENINLEKYEMNTLETYFLTLAQLNEKEAKGVMLYAVEKFPSSSVTLNMASFFYTEIELNFEKALDYSLKSIAVDSSLINLAHQNKCLILIRSNQNTNCCEILEVLDSIKIFIYPELEVLCKGLK